MYIGPEPRFVIPISTRKVIIKEWLNYQHTKIFCKNPLGNVSKDLLDLGRVDLKRVVEVITNHCGLNKHLHKINKSDSPMCLCRRGEETGAHIIGVCPRYRLFRKDLLGKPELDQTDLSLKSLDVRKLATFLSRTNRL